MNNLTRSMYGSLVSLLLRDYFTFFNVFAASLYTNITKHNVEHYSYVIYSLS